MDLYITLQATKNLDAILATCRLGDLVLRVPPFVPLHEEWWSPNNNLLVTRKTSILEAIDYVKQTKNGMVDDCESEGGSD